MYSSNRDLMDSYVICMCKKYHCVTIMIQSPICTAVFDNERIYLPVMHICSVRSCSPVYCCIAVYFESNVIKLLVSDFLLGFV